MAKPTSTYPFATAPDATLEPDDGAKLGGFNANDKPPARWHNWLFNGAHKWHEYLKNLHAESEFLDKDYSWTGMARFAKGYIANNWGVLDEVLYVDDNGALTPKARPVRLPLTAFRSDNPNTPTAPGWQYGGGSQGEWWISGVNATVSPLVCEFRLPAGVVLKSLRAEVGTTTPNTVTAIAGISRVTEGAGSDSVAITSSSTNNDADGMIQLPVGWGVTMTSDDVVYVRFTSVTPYIPLYWAKLLVDDIGPRNF
jgi:hypothetical protein